VPQTGLTGISPQNIPAGSQDDIEEDQNNQVECTILLDIQGQADQGSQKDDDQYDLEE
jgi:hypothetical protein